MRTRHSKRRAIDHAAFDWLHVLGAFEPHAKVYRSSPSLRHPRLRMPPKAPHTLRAMALKREGKTVGEAREATPGAQEPNSTCECKASCVHECVVPLCRAEHVSHMRMADAEARVSGPEEDPVVAIVEDLAGWSACALLAGWLAASFATCSCNIAFISNCCRCGKKDRFCLASKLNTNIHDVVQPTIVVSCQGWRERSRGERTCPHGARGRRASGHTRSWRALKANARTKVCTNPKYAPICRCQCGS